MDSATILVTVLIAGAIPLLVWFEVNSRRNAARKKQEADSAQPNAAAGSRQPGETSPSEIDETKAA